MSKASFEFYKIVSYIIFENRLTVFFYLKVCVSTTYNKHFRANFYFILSFVVNSNYQTFKGFIQINKTISQLGIFQLSKRSYVVISTSQNRTIFSKRKLKVKLEIALNMISFKLYYIDSIYTISISQFMKYYLSFLI